MRPIAIVPIALLASLLLPQPLAAEEDNPEKTAAAMITPATEEAIQRGLAYLASHQQEDGTLTSGGYRGNVAVVGLTGLAMMAGGNTPNRGPYGQETARALDYILAHTQESGFIIGPPDSVSQGPMYGHGFATLFLGEAYGMSPRPELRDKLARAVKLIVNTQNRDGGWRYRPERADADISVTICQVMALRAARNAGLHVPNETITRSIDYVKRSQNPDGGFMYTLQQSGGSRFARSAAGVVALYSAGVYEGPELSRGIDYLMKFLPGGSTSDPAVGTEQVRSFYFYGHYYAVQAMWHRGGDAWTQWFPAVRDEMLSLQQDDGSWVSPVSYEYATAMACIVLQLPNNCLPIFQR